MWSEWTNMSLSDSSMKTGDINQQSWGYTVLSRNGGYPNERQFQRDKTMADYPWGGMESPISEQPTFGMACRIDVRTTSYILGFDPDTHILGLTRRSKWDKKCCNTMLDASKSAKLHQIMYKAKDGTKCRLQFKFANRIHYWKVMETLHPHFQNIAGKSPLGFMPPLSKPSLFPGLGSELEPLGLVSQMWQRWVPGLSNWSILKSWDGPTWSHNGKIWKNLKGDPTGGVHNKAVGKHVSMRLDLQQPIVWYQKDPKGLNTVTYRSDVIWVGPSYLQQNSEPGHVIIDFKAAMLPKSIRVHADPW